MRSCPSCLLDISALLYGTPVPSRASWSPTHSSAWRSTCDRTLARMQTYGEIFRRRSRDSHGDRSLTTVGQKESVVSCRPQLTRRNMDKLSPIARSALMSRIRGKDTTPELIVRSLVHRLGYRFRLHVADLPGRPDLVFPSRRKVMFVHGCFWHAHPKCRRAFRPATRASYWAEKLKANRARDRRNLHELEKLGWSALVVWECEVRRSGLSGRLQRFLGRKLRLGSA